MRWLIFWLVASLSVSSAIGTRQTEPCVDKGHGLLIRRCFWQDQPSDNQNVVSLPKELLQYRLIFSQKYGPLYLSGNKQKCLNQFPLYERSLEQEKKSRPTLPNGEWTRNTGFGKKKQITLEIKGNDGQSITYDDAQVILEGIKIHVHRSGHDVQSASFTAYRTAEGAAPIKFGTGSLNFERQPMSDVESAIARSAYRSRPHFGHM